MGSNSDRRTKIRNLGTENIKRNVRRKKRDRFVGQKNETRTLDAV